MLEDCKQEDDFESNLCNEIREYIKDFGWQSVVLDCHPADITPNLIDHREGRV